MAFEFDYDIANKLEYKRQGCKTKARHRRSSGTV
jgi:hypothetical protein